MLVPPAKARHPYLVPETAPCTCHAVGAQVEAYQVVGTALRVARQPDLTAREKQGFVGVAGPESAGSKSEQ